MTITVAARAGSMFSACMLAHAASRWRIGLVGHPLKVVRVTADDRPCGDARNLVRVAFLHALHDRVHQRHARVQGRAPLGSLEDLSAPTVDGPDGCEIVNARA